jgi:hypothetical protein
MIYLGTGTQDRGLLRSCRITTHIVLFFYVQCIVLIINFKYAVTYNTEPEAQMKEDHNGRSKPKIPPGWSQERVLALFDVVERGFFKPTSVGLKPCNQCLEFLIAKVARI